MERSEFNSSLTQEKPPDGPVYLQALWYDAKGDWARAHQLVDSLPGAEAAWVHAYLHRKEGDENNARYWYRQAGRSLPQVSLDTEWDQLVNEFVTI